jgi:hypothetical protein
MAIFESGLFTDDDFLQIENVLYSPKEQELIHRSIFNINDSWASFAREIGYDYMIKQGRAKIISHGGGAKDIPFVGEKGGRATQKVYTIGTGIHFTKAEQRAQAAKRALGKGPAIQLDTTRVATARRFVFEEEARIAFVGDSEYNMTGIFDDSFYTANLGTKENVAQGAVGVGAAAKRLWSNKTALEILTDLQRGKSVVQGDALYEAKVLALPPAQFERLTLPFSPTGDSRTLMTWLRSEGMFFNQIVKSNRLKAVNNGDTVDYMMILDNDPENVELSLVNDIFLGDPIFDLVGTMEQAVMLDTAGIIVRRPQALYIGKGI